MQPSTLKGVLTVAAHHRIKGRDLLDDIRSGMTDAELMGKYEISFQALQNAFQQLLDARVLTEQELRQRSSSNAQAVSPDDTRRLPRNFVVFPIPIRDPLHPENKGTVRDITEESIGTIGIKADLDEIIPFEILPSELVSVGPVLFDAKCRWIKRDLKGVFVGGFEIIFITEESKKRLRKLIREVTFG